MSQAVPSVDFDKFVRRILAIVQADGTLYPLIRAWRLHDLPEQTQANDFPAVYVTTASSPEVSRDAQYGTSDPDTLPVERVTLEFWVVILVSTMDPTVTQTTIYELTRKVVGILARNTQLRDPETGADPLCTSSRVYTQGRLEAQRGKLLEAMTIRVRPVTYTTGERQQKL